MNRDQKAAVIEEITGQIQESDAIFAVDYRGLSVPQAAELRTRLRDVDATFTVVKNSLTERAADQAGAPSLKVLLQGPTALTFVRGDAAAAAKALADYGRITQLLPFKGGTLGADTLDADQIRAISRLPSRDVLYGQLVGVVAAPVSGLVRTLNALIGGLAVALGQVQAKKESGEVRAGDAPADATAAEPDAPAAEAAGDAPAPAEPDSPAEQEEATEAPAATAVEEPPSAEAGTGEAPAEAEPASEEPAASAPAEVAEEAVPAGETAAVEAPEPETESQTDENPPADASA